MRPAIALAGLLLVALPSASALELGDLQLASAPEEPLRGHITIRGTGPVALSALDVTRASDRGHARAGINPSTLPPRLTLQQETSPADRIRVTTAAPTAVSEPGGTLEFLVRLRWPDGQLLRRYRIANEGGRLQASPASSARFGPTRSGDTLYSLAQQLRPPTVTNNQMMLSLLAENPASFSADNVNALRRDSYLAVPRGEALRFPDEATATERVRAQGRSWQADGGASTATGSASTTSTAPPSSPVPRLQLLPPDPRLTGSGSGDVGERLDAALEPLEAQLQRLESSNAELSQQNRSLQATLSRLEADLSRLEAQSARPVPPPDPPAPTETLTAGQVRAWLEGHARAALASPVVTLRRPAVQWTLGATALVLSLILLGLVRRRRARENTASAMPNSWRPAGGRVEQSAGVAETSLGEPRVRPLDEAPEDPLAQASERIAHGRLEAAQAVLDEALGEAPDSIDLRLKLLDVLAMRSDRSGFEAEAHVLRAQLDDPDDERWRTVARKGRALSPDHPLFQA
ncbi:hypothetical protein FPL11_07690 [Spiribacter aquaticus]|uniref:FimV N-terminal domain-containing protein n=1 Tax=Spiribacter aquaticus TaxID=1935996 RepID=A0A557RHB8_9GAMM|nr:MULTISPECIES: FimV/HubP family polar landmark protein [Spiribacter]KAF0280727.1 hypothetical protein BA897_08665 [Spiribacter roseus]TVO64525.1 hypothetical protein FPL11_07690 [Spiribacter aquaticus]